VGQPPPSAPSPNDRSIRHDTAGLFADAIGPRGVTQAQLDIRLASLAGARDILGEAAGQLAGVCRNQDLPALQARLERLSQGARTLVLFAPGIAGSGAKALAQLAGWNIPGGADVRQKSRPRTRFYDSADPRTLSGALASDDLATKRFVIIDPTGTSPVALAQAGAVLQTLDADGLGLRARDLGLGLTCAQGSTLAEMLTSRAIPVHFVPDAMPQSFHILSAAGLLPAMARGMAAQRMIAGAMAVLERHLAGPASAHDPIARNAAAIAALLAEGGVTLLTVAPFSDRLGAFGTWLRDLWIEVLGSSASPAADVSADGPVDPFQSITAFARGPRRLVTVLRLDPHAAAAPRHTIEPVSARPGTRGPAASGTGFPSPRAVVDAQEAFLAHALAGAGVPARFLAVADLDEDAIGGFVMHMTLEAILAGRLVAAQA